MGLPYSVCSFLTRSAVSDDQRESATAFDFETAMAELEAIVRRLEQGELSLEASLAQFERGITLARQCQQALDEAQRRVEILTAQGPRPFTEDEADV